MKTAIGAFVIGFVGAVLFAPKSGSELRREFWRSIDDIEAVFDKELESRGIL